MNKSNEEIKRYIIWDIKEILKEKVIDEYNYYLSDSQFELVKDEVINGVKLSSVWFWTSSHGKGFDLKELDELKWKRVENG